MRIIIFLFIILFVLAVFVKGQNWSNGGGNPSRNGYCLVNGPSKDTVLWQTSSAGIFGMPLYIEGNKLVTMRFLSTTNAPIECYNLTTGTLLWKKEITGLRGRSLPVGFKNNMVYAVNVQETPNDTLYAFNADNGNKVWIANVTVASYLSESVCFASNGDLLIYGQYKMKRINYLNGQLVWETPFITFASGGMELTVYNNTGYYVKQMPGGYPHLAAINLTNGQEKYTFLLTDTHPGGPLQQCLGVIVGPNGTIYVHKQGDNITAFNDNGSSLVKLWETEIFGSAPFSSFCVGRDGSVYAPSEGKIIRINQANGQILNYSPLISTNIQLFQCRISATQNDIVYATNGESGIFAYTLDLTQLWTDVIPNVNTSGAVIGGNGVVAVAGNNIIKVYKAGAPIKIDELTVYEQPVIYPNPVRNILNIKNSNTLIHSDYWLYDQTGRLILNGKLSDNYNTINVDFLPCGMYFLKLGNDKEQIFKLVKN